MAKEIERRFLVRSLGTEMSIPEQKLWIEQGYFELVDPTKSQRIRIVNNTKAFLTSKSGKGLSRTELEVRTEDIGGGLNVVRKLYKLSDHKLEKERWVLDGWEIDFFMPPLQGIIMAEKELESENESLILPVWLKESIEVTCILTNHQLARLASDLRDVDCLDTKLLSHCVFHRLPKLDIYIRQIIEQALKTSP